MMPKNQELSSCFQESRFKIQESSFKNNQDQDSRLKIQESREVLKKFSKTLSSTRSFHKIITKEF